MLGTHWLATRMAATVIFFKDMACAYVLADFLDQHKEVDLSSECESLSIFCVIIIFVTLAGSAGLSDYWHVDSSISISLCDFRTFWYHCVSKYT